MGRRPPHCSEEGSSVRRAWTAMEDKILTEYIKINGEGQWKYVPQRAGLERGGKSCRLRWLNYLKPGIKRGNISQEEEDLIIKLHQHLGNRWSLIAEGLPGRTENEIKNYWHTKISKKIKHVNRDGDSTASSDSKPSNDHESLEWPSLSAKKQRGVCEVPAPSHQNEVGETTSMPWPAKTWDVFGVHDEQFETILSPVLVLEENYQLMYDDVWMDFEIWNNLS